MPNIDLSILNQRQTPAFYADVFANRPAAGFVGRIFVSTNTFAFYRDNGTSWDLIGGPGTGTVTGTGANGQVTYWNGASTITGSNDLFWDSANGHFGIGTNVPGTALDVHHDQSTVAILNQTVATNDVRIGFQNNGVGLWRIGAFYNAGANDFGIFDAVAAIQPVTVKKTTGQVLIGTSTVGSGKLVVASSTGDNGVQIVGASAPSLRIDNAESGPTKRAGLGISTATNNFIQGSADRDFCMFNGSTTASPILFGIYGTTNVQEAARISAARNFLIGTTTDGGQKLQVSGSARATGYFLDGMTAGSGALYWGSSTDRVTLANYNVNGILEFEVNGGNQALTINADLTSTFNNSILAQKAQNTTTKFEAKNTTAGTDADAAFISTSDTSSGASVWGKKSSAVTTYKILTPSNSYWYNGTAGDISILNDFASGNIKLAAGGSSITNFLIASTGDATFSNDVQLNGPVGNRALTILTNTSGNAILNLVAAGSNSGTIKYVRSNSLLSFDNGAATDILSITSTGNILIGTTTDSGRKLQVNGDVAIGTTGSSTVRLFTAGSGTSSAASAFIAGDVGGNTLLSVRNDGNIGTGLQAASPYNNNSASAANVIVFTDGTLGRSTSSLKYKNNVRNYDKGLDIINKMRPVYYNGNNDGNTEFAGLIAEEIHDLGLNEFVQYAKDGSPDALAYSNMIALLIKGIQELNTKIENLK